MEIKKDGENLTVGDVTYYPNGWIGLDISEIWISHSTWGTLEDNEQNHNFSEHIAAKAFLKDGRKLRLINTPGELDSVNLKIVKRSAEEISDCVLANLNYANDRQEDIGREELDEMLGRVHGYAIIEMREDDFGSRYNDSAPLVATCRLTIEERHYDAIRLLIEEKTISNISIGLVFNPRYGLKFDKLYRLYTDKPDTDFCIPHKMRKLDQFPSKMNYLAPGSEWPQDEASSDAFGVVSELLVETNKLHLFFPDQLER